MMKSRHTAAGQVSSLVQMWLSTSDLLRCRKEMWISFSAVKLLSSQRLRAHLANFIEFPRQLHDE